MNNILPKQKKELMNMPKCLPNDHNLCVTNLGVCTECGGTSLCHADRPLSTPPSPAIGARWVRASERVPEEYEAVSWEYDDGTPLSLPAVRLAIKKGWQEKIFWLEKPPATFPTREQAEEWVKVHCSFPATALAMYDWIVQQLNPRP